MRFKYYLRGAGIGVILTTLIFTIAFAVYKPTLSDDEIMQKAEALGMEMPADDSDSADKKDTKTAKDQKDDADDGDDGQILAEQHQCQQRTDTGGRQGGQDRDRVDIAFIQDTEHDVHRDNGGEDQPER